MSSVTKRSANSFKVGLARNLFCLKISWYLLHNLSLQRAARSSFILSGSCSTVAFVARSQETVRCQRFQNSGSQTVGENSKVVAFILCASWLLLGAKEMGIFKCFQFVLIRTIRSLHFYFDNFPIHQRKQKKKRVKSDVI